MKHSELPVEYAHSACDHCRHVVAPAVAPKPRKPFKSLTAEEKVLHIFDTHSHRVLNRSQIRQATELTPHEIMNILRDLVRKNKIAYSGASVEARNAKFKLCGSKIWE